MRPENGLTEAKKTSSNPSFPTNNLFRIKKSTALALSMQNHAPAQGFLKQDNVQAAVWFRKSADQNNPAAQALLGELYLSGSGVPQDYSEAYFWLDLGASGNIGDYSDSFLQTVKHNRDAAALHLTQTSLSQSQARASKWFSEHSTSSIR